MSDQNLDINIRVKQEGAQQAARGVEEIADATRKLDQAQAQGTQSTQQATKASHELDTAVKQLSADFPELASMASLAGAGVGAGVALAVKSFISYVEIMREAENQGRRLESAAQSLAQNLLNALEMQSRAEMAEESFARIQRSVEGVNAALKEQQELLLLAKREQSALRDAELNKALEDIEADPNLKGSQKILRKQQVQEEFRARKQAEVEQALAKEIAVQEAAAKASGKKSGELGAALAPASQALQSAVDQETTSSKDKTQIEQHIGAMLKEVQAERDMVSAAINKQDGRAGRFFGASGVGVAAGLLHPGNRDEAVDAAQLGWQGLVPSQEQLNQLDEQLAVLGKLMQDAAVVAKQDQIERQRLERNYNELLKERNKAESERLAAEKTAASKRRELESTQRSFDVTEPIINSTERSKAGRQATEKDRADEEKAARQIEREENDALRDDRKIFNDYQKAVRDAEKTRKPVPPIPPELIPYIQGGELREPGRMYFNQVNPGDLKSTGAEVQGQLSGLVGEVLGLYAGLAEEISKLKGEVANHRGNIGQGLIG